MSKQTSGIGWIVVSFALWGGALAMPFVEGSVATRAGAGVGLYGLSYLVFGWGCRQLGGAVWPRLRQRLQRTWSAWRAR